MGVDLTLLPESFGGDERPYSFHALRLDRDRELWREIEQSGLEIAVGRPVTCHFARTPDGETCYGSIEETPYGTPLTKMMAGQIADIMSARPQSRNNQWILAALNAMPRDLPVYLYWS